MTEAIVELFPDYPSSIPDKTNQTILGRVVDHLKSRITDRCSAFRKGLYPSKVTRLNAIHVIEERNNRDCWIGSFEVVHAHHDSWAPVLVRRWDRSKNAFVQIGTVDTGQVSEFYLQPPPQDAFLPQYEQFDYETRYHKPFLRITHLPRISKREGSE